MLINVYRKEVDIENLNFIWKEKDDGATMSNIYSGKCYKQTTYWVLVCSSIDRMTV